MTDKLLSLSRTVKENGEYLKFWEGQFGQVRNQTVPRQSQEHHLHCVGRVGQVFVDIVQFGHTK